MMGTMSLRWRITLPFVGLFLVVFGALWFLSVRGVKTSVERRFQGQADDLSRLMARRGFPVNARSLAYIREAYGADVAIVKLDRVVEATLPAAHVKGALPGRVVRGGQDYFVVQAPWGTEGRLLLFFPGKIVDREREEAVRPTVVLGIAGILLAVFLGLLLGQAVARPLERVVEQIRRTPEHPVPAPGGGPEVSHLVEALNRRIEEVRRAEQLAVMGKMAVGVAHEIKNPLAAMKLTVQMLREEATDRDPYDLLLREIDRLELAAGELGGTAGPEARRVVSVAEVVDEVLRLLEPQLKHLGVTAEREYRDPDTISIEPARFKRVVMNLLLNGAQAMPAGGRLQVRVGPGDVGSVRLSVRDEGDGIPRELGERVFEPFVTNRPGGVGLGLALTKGIVEGQGGKIFFEGAEPGTIFTVELPNHVENPHGR